MSFFKKVITVPKMQPLWRNLLLSMLFILTSLLCFSPPVYAQAQPSSCNHGMRIVGEKSIYLSHMGLFNSRCHEYQALFQVSFQGTNDPQKIYLQAQGSNPNNNEFTLKPVENFPLSDLEKGARKSFTANIFSGQFECQRNPIPIAKNVTVQIEKVLHFRKFQPGAKQPSFSEYLLFGNDQEQLAAHLITAPPDFDQIIALKQPLPGLTLASATRLGLPNRPVKTPKDNFNQALTPGVKPAVQIDGQGANLTVEIGNQYFMEKGNYEAPPRFCI
jgi:hypothetical protein